MDDEKIKKYIATLTEQMIVLQRQITNLRASVTVLKAALTLQLTPGDALEGAKMLRKAEELILSRDPDAKQLEEVEQVVEAVNLWKKHGSPRHES